MICLTFCVQFEVDSQVGVEFESRKLFNRIKFDTNIQAEYAKVSGEQHLRNSAKFSCNFGRSEADYQRNYQCHRNEESDCLLKT